MSASMDTQELKSPLRKLVHVFNTREPGERAGSGRDAESGNPGRGGEESAEKQRP